MCAINGFTWNDQDLILKMNQKTSHRGPDDTGVFLSNNISLGHNRLSIIDLSDAAHQPMSTSDKRYTIVYNGELYNFQELRKDLKKIGYTFRSNSDTEVVLNLFAHEGTRALHKMIGIFSFAIWDSHENQLFLARDQFGIKPLYFYHDKDKFIFSSEAKAILEHNISCSIDEVSFNNYFRFLYAQGPRTMWSEIKKLPPGSFAFVSGGKIKIERYWNLKKGGMIENENDLLNLIRARVREAVRSQLVSDRPVGLFLSGGLDSSIILSMMAQETEGTINTFSVGFDTTVNPEKFNADFIVAQKSAEHFGTRHHPILVSASDVAKHFEDCVIAMDEPVSNHIEVATYLLSKEAKKHVAVVLGGDGGDETWGGYDRYWYYRLISQIQKSFPFLKKRETADLLGRLTKKPELFRKFATEGGVDRFFSMMSQKESQLARFINKDYNNGLMSVNTYSPYFIDPLDDEVNQYMFTDMRTWLTDESLVRSDKLTMAFGLEQRIPFLDPRLVELAFMVPSRYKLNSRRQGKKILKEAFQDVMPEFVLSQDKRGFFSPTAKWIRGELSGMVYEILSPSYCDQTRDLFDWNSINLIIDDHMEYRGYALNTIWSLMTFQVWARKYL